MAIDEQDIWKQLDALTKPPRSLGRLEELAVRLCLVQQTLKPQTLPRKLVLFAADHGVASAGVTAWPADVTGLMVQTIAASRAASTVFARQSQTETTLVNVGTRRPLESLAVSPEVTYRDARLLPGTRNLTEEPALTGDELSLAFDIGRQEAQAAADSGARVVVAGEMGIGNTTPAACLAMLLADVPLEQAVGRGAGADDRVLERKRAVAHSAVTRSREMWRESPRAAIAAVSGLEIAAIAGFYMAAHTSGLTIVLDGYVTTAAALIAEHLQPGTSQSMIAAHLSAEPGHRLSLQKLGLTPFLDWSLRLGEGTGGLLLLPLLDAAAAMIGQMATLDSLGIPGEPPA